MVDEPLWWRRPTLREDEDEVRRASWLELFVDLMFVAIISACARGLASDISLAGVARYCTVFLPAWWIWLGLTVYNDRLDTDDVSHRLSFFVIMVALGGMAVSVREFFTNGFAIYALSYVTARIVIVALSGGILPLAVFGSGPERVLSYLPFRFTIQFPTELLAGRPRIE